MRTYALLLVAAMVGVLFVSTPIQAATGINGQVNFQGRLLTPQGATVPDGYYNIQFKIYQDGDGLTAGDTTGTPAGTLKWTESHLNAASQGVAVKNGYLSVQLGSITAFGSSVDWNQDTLWLSINIAGLNATCTPFTSCTPDGEMLPMKRLSATPYALNSQRLGGLTSSQFIQSTTVPQAANIAVQSTAAGSVAAVVVGAASQTADVFQVQANGTATSLFAVGAAGAASLQNSADSTSAFTVKNQNSRLVLGVDTTNGKVTLGNITSTSGAGVAGTLVLADGTNDNYGLTLNTATLTANRSVSLADEAGTICLRNSAACGFLTGAASDYIQNQNAGQQASSNFWISGYGRADTGLQAPLLDTASAMALNIGTTNATGINLNKSTTVAGSLTLTGSTTSTFTSPGSASIPSRINIATLNPGVGGAIISAGISSAAPTSSTGLLLFDARTAAHDATIAVISPDELQVLGLGWDGSNSTAVVKNTGGWLGLQASGKNLLTFGSGVAGSKDFYFGNTGETVTLFLTNASNSNLAGIKSGVTTSSYNSVLPTAIGSAGQCLAIASVSGSDQNLGYNTCLTAEADTLASVTGRGATTTTATSLQGGAAIRGVTIDTATATDDLIAMSVTTGGGARFTGTITNADLNAARTWTLPNESGTFCMQSSSNCGFLTGATSDYIQNQNTAQQASTNFWISGVGRTDTAIQAPLFDATTAGAALNLGTTNATAGINLNQSTTIASGKTLMLASGSFKGTFSTAALTANRAITVPDAGGTLAVSASGNIALSGAGDITFTGVLPIANGGTNASTAQGAINSISGLTTNGDLLYSNGTNSTRLARGSNGQCLLSDTTTILWSTCVTAEADTLATVTSRGATTSTALLLQGGATVRGVTIDTATATDDKIAISVTGGGASSFTGTITSTDLTAARTWTLPDAGGTFCLQNSASCGFLTSSTGVTLQSSSPGSAQTGNFNITGTGIAGTLQSNAMSVLGSAGVANITIGTASTNNGQITFASSTTPNTAIIQGGATSASYTTVLPTAIGTAGQCLTVGSVAGSTQNLGYVGCLTTANSVELQATTPGTAQTGHFNISGTGIVGTLQTGLVAAADDTSITVRGGNATVTNTNGGSITVTGGAGNGTGVTGLINLGPSASSAVVNTSCSADCTISQANVDSYGTVVISATTSSIIITLPTPTITATKGRTIFVTTASGSQDFTLRTNAGGANQIDVAMRQNTTSNMIWNGTAWTPGGASNATTLQATYNNGSNPSTTPEIKLDSIRGTIDIQDADTTIGTDLFNIRGSNASGLGTVLFGVSNTGRVTVQDTSDTSSSFRVLNSTGNYLLNVNGYSNYTFNNTIRSSGNEIANPSFESGGAITGGEAGWFGPAQAAIVNSAANSHGGNYQLQITANTSDIDVFAGSYIEVIPGEMLYLSGWVKNSSGASGNAGIQITWYDKDKAVLSSSTDYSGVPGTSYVMKKVNGTAPAGAVFARVSATTRASSAGTFYFDDFYLKRSLESSPFVFQNAIDTTSAFKIQSASAAQTLFSADTTNNIVKVGDASGSDTQTTILVLDSATANPTTGLSTRNGGLFYRSDTNSLKAIVGGAVVDVCTTAVTCTGYSASAGASVQLQGTSPGTQQSGNFNITGTGILTQLQTMDQTVSSTNSANLVIRSGNATGAGSNSGNLTLDVGNANATPGSIQIGHTNVATTMPGTLKIQGGSSLELGLGSTNTGQVLFYTSTGANTVTLQGPSANPTSSYTLTLPQNLGANGECIKTDTTGGLYFQGCGVGINYNLQDAYNNSGTPATITLADGKNIQFTAQDTTTDPNIVFNLQCVTSCGTNGVFKVTTTAGDVFTVKPNSQGIVLNTYTQIGSNITDGTQVNFQVDSSNSTSDQGTCTNTTNQGAMYYNTSMGSLRACLNGAWGDVSNPDTLGLLTFGIVPSTGSQPYDLPSLVTTGASGPCKVSWASATSVYVEACTAYTNGRRTTVTATTLSTNSATAPNINLTTSAQWGHVCLDGTTGQPKFTSTTGGANALANLPNFNVSSPILCLADVQGSATSGGTIDNLYDVRTFTSTLKEAVVFSTASELGMLVDSSTGVGLVPSASCTSGTCSGKLYGAVVATNGGTSTGPVNGIVASVGPAYVKAVSGNAGEFVKSSATTGYAATVTAIPNNAFYFSPGNSRTTYQTACTSAATCLGSLYINFIVR